MSGSRPIPVVAHVLPHTTIGGGEVATLRVVAGIARRGDYHHIAFTPMGSDVARAFADEGIETVPFSSAEFSYRHWRPYARSTFAMARAFRLHRVELVHCSDLMAAYQAAFAARLLRARVLCHIRSSYPPEDIPRHHKPPIAAVHHFVFVSQAVRNHFKRIYRIPESRGTLVYDGVSFADACHADSPSAVRVELGLPSDAFVVGMVARVVPIKDFETVIAALDQVVTVLPRVRLLLVGEQCDLQYRVALGELIRERHLDEHVIWTGYRRDPTALMRAMDVTVLATRSEGFGLVLVEAMAQRRPVIATRVGGIPEIITDGETGLLHDPGDASSLARAILRLADDPVFASDLAMRGYVMAEARFNIDKTVSEMSALYSRLMPSPRRSGETVRVET